MVDAVAALNAHDAAQQAVAGHRAVGVQAGIALGNQSPLAALDRLGDDAVGDDAVAVRAIEGNVADS
jgi:hypothetical protein